MDVGFIVFSQVIILLFGFGAHWPCSALPARDPHQLTILNITNYDRS